MALTIYEFELAVLATIYFNGLYLVAATSEMTLQDIEAQFTIMKKLFSEKQ